MAGDQTTDAATSERRDAVREKAKKVNARIRRRKIVRRVVIVVLIVAAVFAAGWWVWRTVTPELERELVTPQNVTDSDGIDVIGLMPEDERPDTEDEPFAIDVYLDYMSPDAGVIEQTLAPEMRDWIDEGVVTLTYHPVSLLSSESNGSQYSTRAAGAVMCVVEESPAAFLDVQSALLADQPEFGDEGYTDEELAAIAADAGASGVDDCIADRTYAPWIGEATERALEDGLPEADGVQLSDALVVVDGEKYEGALDDAAEFSQYLFTRESEREYGETGSDPE